MLCYLAFGFPPYMAMAMHTDYYVGRDGRQKLRGKQKKSRGMVVVVAGREPVR